MGLKIRVLLACLSLSLILAACSLKVVTINVDYVPVKNNQAKLFTTENTAVPQGDDNEKR